LSLVLGIAGSGCAGSDAPPVQDDAGSAPQADKGQGPDQTPGPDPDAIYTLTLVGWQDIKVQQGQHVTLQVRYSRNNQVLASESIQFKFVGDSKDSTLSTLSAVTNGQGLAETVLAAGQIVGTFKVEATAAKANPVQWNVEVAEKPVVPPAVNSLSGTLELTSNFDLQGKFDGSELADALNVINEISDEPMDPGKYIVDAILDEIAGDINNQTLFMAASLLKPILYDGVQKLLLSIAPDMIMELKEVAAGLSAVARKFTITSEMVSAAPQPVNANMTVDHGLTKIAWTFKGKKAEYAFYQLGVVPKVNNVALVPNTTVQGGVNISEHTFQLKFGSFLLVALNNLVIPYVNPKANSISTLIGAYVDCPKVAKTINDEVGFGGEAVWANACAIAMSMVTSLVEGKIIDLDQEQSVLTLNGQCKLVDNTTDAFIDAATEGLWTGTMKLSKATTLIGGPNNNFTGKRIK
jgi:hypothetical protein